MIQKANNVEQLVLRLQLDELNELGRAQQYGIIKVNTDKQLKTAEQASQEAGAEWA